MEVEMEVTVISKEHIKPSSPTPPHLRMYKHCFLDLIIPVSIAPVILYYSQGVDPNRLKESLSKTLPRFHPLAGRVKDKHTIECNDEGALFVMTRVNSSLYEFLSKPDLLLMRKLLPSECVSIGTSAGSHISMFQVNTFDCGGTAIATCIAHKFLDGFSVGTFLRGWSEMAWGGDSTLIPDYSASSIFPVDESPLMEALEVVSSLFDGIGTGVTRRFIFDSSAIAALKTLARSSDNENPTRVEVISSFIWKQEMAARRKLDMGEQKTSFLIPPINLRKRMKPALPEHSLGNILWGAATYCNEDNLERSLADLVAKVRTSIRRVSAVCENLTTENSNSKFVEIFTQRQATGLGEEGVNCYGVTSWCRFGYYETDFGWGKPVWMSTVGMGSDLFLKMAILYDTKNGDGVEAWITLDEKSMEVIEKDEEMRKYATLNPCPLNFNGGRVTE